MSQVRGSQRRSAVGAALSLCHHPHLTTVVTPEAADRRRRLAQTVAGAGTTAYTRDALGLATSVTRGGSSVGYAYDAEGRLASLTYPFGGTVAYTYDAAGQPDHVTDWNGHVYD